MKIRRITGGWARIALPAVALAAGLLQSSAAPAQTKPDERQRIVAGATVILAPSIEFDTPNRRHVFSDDVELTTPESVLTARRMVVQFTPKQELEWAECTGDVHIVRTPAGGGRVEAWSSSLKHLEQQKESTLSGGVRVLQSSPRLEKPAEVLGERAVLNGATQINVVYGQGGKQASVEVHPKGDPAVEGKPAAKPAEPARLIGDRIEMNQKTQEYHATGNPVFTRPSGTLKANDIRFTVDEKTNEIQRALATGKVVYDGKNPRGALIHARGDVGTFDRSSSILVLDGSVYATTQEPDDEQPMVWEGDRFEYNTTSGAGKLTRKTGRASVKIPENKLESGNKKPEGEPPKPKTDGPKPPAGAPES